MKGLNRNGSRSVTKAWLARAALIGISVGMVLPLLCGSAFGLDSKDLQQPVPNGVNSGVLTGSLLALPEAYDLASKLVSFGDDRQFNCYWQSYFQNIGYAWKMPHDQYCTQPYAQRFSVIGPETLLTVEVAIYDFEGEPWQGNGVVGNDDINIQVYDDDGFGFPGTLLAEVTLLAGTYPFYPDWAVADFSTYGLVFTRDFYVAVSSNGNCSQGDYEALLSDDGTNPLGRGYCFNGGQWWTMFTHWGVDFNFLIDVYLCREMQQISPGQGLSLYQLDLTYPQAEQLNSPYGLAVVHIDSLLTATGMPGGFVNMATDSGWVVRNLPVDTASGYPGISVMFDLASSGDVSTISASASISQDPVVEYTGDFRTTFPVGNLANNAQGLGDPRPDPPGIRIDLSEIVFTPVGRFEHEYQSGHPNIEVDFMQCAPASVANSLQWLEDEYGVVVPHPHQPGIRDNTLVGQLDIAMNRPAHDGVATADEILEGKLGYISDNDLAFQLDIKHKNRVGGSELPDADVTVGNATSHADTDATTSLIDWIISELDAGEDVEVCFIWDGGGGHCVDVTGAGYTFGRAWISWVHDANQGAVGDQTANNGGNNWYDGGHGFGWVHGDHIVTYVGGSSVGATMEFALSESPDRHWGFHPFVDGTLKVWGTINCVNQEPPLVEGHVEHCNWHQGSLPSWANDFYVWLEQDGSGDDFYYKFAVPQFVRIAWDLTPVKVWVSEYLDLHPDDTLRLPMISDSTGVPNPVYAIVNPEVWAADERPFQGEYDIVDGVCDDLPGYMIGTTPIVFDSLADPQGPGPFSTIPYTGTLWLIGETGFWAPTTGGCCNHDGMRGDVNGDGNGPNIVDLTYLVEYLFGGGDEPPCDEEADVNADGATNIVDLTYLVGYLFGNGSPPVECP